MLSLSQLRRGEVFGGLNRDRYAAWRGASSRVECAEVTFPRHSRAGDLCGRGGGGVGGSRAKQRTRREKDAAAAGGERGEGGRDSLERVDRGAGTDGGIGRC